MISVVKEKLRSTPMVARVAPFFIFAAVTSAQSLFPDQYKYWFYPLRTLVGAWLLWAIWPAVKELRWTFSLHALLVGVGVCVFWVALDPYYPKLDALFPKLFSGAAPWNPAHEFDRPLAIFFIVVRILGSSIVVPPLEEMFYRSFVYRYVITPGFDKIPLTQFHWVSFLVTSTLFGFVHREWLAGILCGFAYQWLVVRKGHLGDAITAHAITNFLLGLYIVYKGAWHFW